MLGHAPFYHEHFRKYVICFGTVFKNMKIIRKSRADGREKEIEVPLFYTTKIKHLHHLLEDSIYGKEWEGGELPRMSFEMTGIQYAGNRKNNTMHYTMKDQAGSSKLISYTPAPYDLSFQLVVYTQMQEDLYQVVEQILPFFQPEYCVKVKEIPSLDLKRDVHIVLTGLDMDLDVSGDYKENHKLLTATFSFSLKGFFFGPVEDKPVITNLDSNLWHMPAGEDWLSSYHAEGDPDTREITKEEWKHNA